MGNLESTATSEAIRAEFSRCVGAPGDQMIMPKPLPAAAVALRIVVATCCRLCLTRTSPVWRSCPMPHCRFGPLLQWQVAPPKLPGTSNLRYAIVSFRKLPDAEAAFNALNKQVWVAPACRL